MHTSREKAVMLMEMLLAELDRAAIKGEIDRHGTNQLLIDLTNLQPRITESSQKVQDAMIVLREASKRLSTIVAAAVAKEAEKGKKIHSANN